jgi:hypothetical protein
MVGTKKDADSLAKALKNLIILCLWKIIDNSIYHFKEPFFMKYLFIGREYLFIFILVDMFLLEDWLLIVIRGIIKFATFK